MIARSLCLGASILRGTLEWAVQFPSDPENVAAYKQLATRLSQWLNQQDFTAHFTIDELNTLSQAPGVWNPAEQDVQYRRMEALGVLFWALSIHEKFPRYDEPFEPPNLEPLLGWPQGAIAHPQDEKLADFPRVGTGWFKQVTQLRPQPVIASQRAAAECWQWRAHVAALQRTNMPAPAGQDYAAMIAIAAEEAHAAGAIPPPLENDFPLFGKPFGQLTEDETVEAANIANARRLALDWLCGYATAWDNVPVASPSGVS